MTMEFTAENVELAVEQFYKSSGGIQAQAHQWLMSAQTSKEAWSFVWPLLLKEGTTSEVQFFGATTLQAKVIFVVVTSFPHYVFHATSLCIISGR
jgi:hypothetical protein